MGMFGDINMNSSLTFLTGLGLGTILTIGGFWFWLLAISNCIWMAWLVSDDSNYYDKPNAAAATTLLIGTAVFLQLFTTLKVISFVILNPGIVLAGFVLYTVIGIAWSFIKWATYLLDWKSKTALSLYKEASYKPTLPSASTSKTRITAWIAYWPWNLLWTLVADYVWRFFTHLFQWLESQYDAVQKRILKDYYTQK
jgi:hypothetical protein